MNGVFAIGRIALVAIFILSGALKLIDIAGTASQIQSNLTIPSALNDFISTIQTTIGLSIWQILATTAGVVELVVALLIAFNVYVRTMAVILFVYTAIMIFFQHDIWNVAPGPDLMTNIGLALKNISIMGGFLILAAWPRQIIADRAAAHEWEDSPNAVGSG
jgi:putative oxidoreductase